MLHWYIGQVLTYKLNLTLFKYSNAFKTSIDICAAFKKTYLFNDSDRR